MLASQPHSVPAFILSYTTTRSPHNKKHCLPRVLTWVKCYWVLLRICILCLHLVLKPLYILYFFRAAEVEKGALHRRRNLWNGDPFGVRECVLRYLKSAQKPFRRLLSAIIWISIVRGNQNDHGRPLLGMTPCATVAELVGVFRPWCNRGTFWGSQSWWLIARIKNIFLSCYRHFCHEVDYNLFKLAPPGGSFN